MSNEVDMVKKGYAAENVGIQSGDKIVRINGKKIRLRSDLNKIMEETKGEEKVVTIQRNNEQIDITLIPTQEITKNIGIYLGVAEQNLSTEIKGIYSNTPAEKIGLKEGDKIISVDDINPKDAYEIVDLISKSNNEKIRIDVKREERILTFYVEPEVIKTYYLGVVFKSSEDTFVNNMYYGFWDTLNFAVTIVDNLKLMFTGNVKVDQLMGPIGISSVVAKTDGIIDFIYMLALISLSLGVTNLLPFPPLDGGKIVILLIQGIRRKPLNEKIEIGIQLAGFALLIILSLYVTYNDILRVF